MLLSLGLRPGFFLFFFNDTATTEIYTLSLHDALPISHRSRADQCTPPFFRAFHALAVDDGGGRTGLPLRAFATLLIKRVVDSLQCAVLGPQIEVVVDRAFRPHVFRDRAPLTPGPANVHH